MGKMLKPETIQGVKFYFEDMGDVVMVSVFGSMRSMPGDYVAIFNNKAEAVKQLKKANITQNSESSISISGLKSIDENKYMGEH